MIKQVFLVAGLLIFIGGFLLVWDSPPESFLSPQAGQIEETPSADSYMTNVVSHRYDTTGAEQFVLSSPKMDFYTGNGDLILTLPQLVVNQAPAANKGSEAKRLNLDAKKGHLSDGGETLYLEGNVVALINDSQGVTKLTAADLTFLPSSNIASTEGPFKLLTPEVTLSGNGLKANLRNEVFTIKSKVRAIHEPL